MSVGFTTAAGLVHEMMEAKDERRLLNLQRQLSRLTHHVHILEMNGESYRLKRSQENAAPQASDDLDNP